MENFMVSARKYRPATFESVVGQQHITGTLKNAIRNNQLAQAFLFCGPRGVGKTTCARILAKTINCENIGSDVEPCGKCTSCISFQNGNSFNIHELDAASNNSVDDIRSLTEQVRIPPQSGRYKIYIIDEVHMLSQAAFNAFLKTLEEPPSYAIFILATTEKHKILPTILSRCQVFDFNRIRVEDMANHLASIAGKEGISFDTDGLHLIAQKADGGLRDALSMFDQIVSFSNRNITYNTVIANLNILDYDYYFRITTAILQQDTASVLVTFDQVLANGFDGNHFINGLASHFRNLLVGKDSVTLSLLEVSEGIRQKYLEQSQVSSISFLLSALNIANQCDLNYKQSRNQRLQVELALIKLCHISSAFHLSSGAIPQAPPAVQRTGPAAEADKKKTPDESLKPAQVAAEAELAPSEPSEPLTKAASSGSSLLSGSTLIPNLNDLSAPAKQEKPAEAVALAGESRTVFSEDEFLLRWNEYAISAKQASKLSLFTIMTASAPKLGDDFTVFVTIENKIQENVLLDERTELLNFLRQELKNYAISIEARQMESSRKRKPYTSTERYQHMVDKNPQVEEFKKRFNLGID
jgi:DNA polymerase-3 subunit gamma/tau